MLEKVKTQNNYIDNKHVRMVSYKSYNDITWLGLV